MICPKCGRENTSTNCPYCDDLILNDNTSEYFKRIEQFKNKDNVKEEVPKETKKKEMSKAKKKALNLYRYFVLIGSLSAAAIIIFNNIRNNRFIVEKGEVVYANNEVVSKIDEKEILTKSTKENLALTTGNTNFFTAPAGIFDNKNVFQTQLIASDDGKYFATTNYENNQNSYKSVIFLYEDKNQIEKIAVDGVSNIIGLANDKTIIYTTTNVLNDEGGLGKKSLFVHKNQENTLISNNLSKLTYYKELNSLIILNADKTLYIYNLNTGENSLISQNVDDVKTENNASDDLLDVEKENINVNKKANLISYKNDKGWYLLDLKNKKNSLISSPQNVEAFAISKKKIFKIADNSLYESYGNENYSEVDKLLSNNSYVFIKENNTIVYIDAGKKLIRYKKTKKAKDENVDGLQKLIFTNGYVYKKQDEFFISKGANKGGKHLMKNQNAENISYLKNKIIYTNENKVFEYNLKTKENKELNKYNLYATSVR